MPIYDLEGGEMSKPGVPEDKKPHHDGEGQKPSGGKPHSSHSGQKPAAIKTGCLAEGCKNHDVRALFCEEHFRQFKFGLITKTGQKVSDYERKYEHYQNYLRAHKVA